MKNHGKVRSSMQPKSVEIDEFSVWVASNIVPVTDEGVDDQPGFTGYEYDLIQYDKNEYIQMMDDKNASLEAQITDTQVALCEVYELMA